MNIAGRPISVTYRSDKPGILEAYQQWVDDMREHGERLRAFNDKYNPDGKLEFRVREHRTFAYFTRPNLEAIPEGWRITGDLGAIVPNKRLKAGKQAEADIDALNKSAPKGLTHRMDGMPDHVFRGNTWATPGAFRWDGAIYVYWSQRPEDVDSAIWTELKLSEFYAAHEACEAAHDYDLKAAA